MAVVITYVCELHEGVHARPAGYIARLCNLFQADIDWENTVRDYWQMQKAPSR